MHEIPNETSFIIYENAAERMFSWLTPYIQLAGYSWKIENHIERKGDVIQWTSAVKITITRNDTKRTTNN